MQNSINLIGWPLISFSLGPAFDFGSNDYQYVFSLDDFSDKDSAPFPGRFEKFSFDYRLTDDPLIDREYLDMFLFGEFNKVGEECKLPQDPFPHEFEPDRPDKSQILISERAISCFLYAFEKSTFSKLYISTKNIEE